MIEPLIEVVKKSEDVYIVRKAVRALGEIDTPESRQFLSALT